MNRCTAILARACDGDAIGTFSLVIGLGDRRSAPLCGACLEAAGRLGYAPSRLPEWRARGSYKDLTGRIGAAA